MDIVNKGFTTIGGFFSKLWDEFIKPKMWDPFFDWIKPKFDDLISWVKIGFYKVIGELPLTNKSKWYSKAAEVQEGRAAEHREIAERDGISDERMAIHINKAETFESRAQTNRDKRGNFGLVGAGAGSYLGWKAGAATGAKIGMILGPKGAAAGAAIGALVGGYSGWKAGQAVGSRIPEPIYQGKSQDGLISTNGRLTKFDSQDQILAAKPDGAISQFLNNAGMSSQSRGNIGGSKFTHSGNVSINLSRSIQLQDPNGNIHNWDNLTRNPQFISQLTEKISMEITKKMNYSSAGDGRLVYGNVSRGMFG